MEEMQKHLLKLEKDVKLSTPHARERVVIVAISLYCEESITVANIHCTVNSHVYAHIRSMA